MPSVSRTIEILFTAVDQTGGGLSSVSDKLGSLNSSVAGATQPFADFGALVLKADAALLALAGGGLAYAFNESKKFESATVELRKVLGDFPDQLEAAQDNALDLSATYGVAARDVLASTAAFKQAGFDVQESMDLAKNSLDLVIAGDIEAAEASNILVSALKGFKAPASDAARLIDVLNEVSNNYATDVQQLGIGMAKLSPIASQMGFSFEETAGVLTPVIEVFRSGDEAAIALKTGLLKLIDDAKPVRDALASIGVSQTDANGQLRSGKDILFDVASAFTTADNNQKTFLASQLVGIQQAARMVEVFDGLSKSTEVSATAMKSAGSAAAEVAARLSSSEVAVNRFVTGFNNLSIAIGDEFRAAAVEAINGGTEITKALEDIVKTGAFDELFDRLEEGLRAIGQTAVEIAGNLPEAFANVDFAKLLSSFDSISDAVGGIFEGLDLTDANDLTEVIQTVIDGIAGLINVTAGMVEGAEPFIEAIQEMVEGFINLDSQSQKSIGEVTGFAGALNKLTGPIGTIIDALGGIGTALQVFAGVKVVQVVQSLIGSQGLSSALSRIGPQFLALAPKVAGVGAVFAASAYAVIQAVSTYREWQNAEEELELSIDRGNAAREELAMKLQRISEQTGVTILDGQDLRKEIEAGTIALNKQTGEWYKITQAQFDAQDQFKKLEAGLVDWSDAALGVVDSNGNLAGVVDATTASMDENAEAAIRVTAAYYEMQGNSPEVARAMAEMDHAVQGTTKTLEKAEEVSEKTKNTMLELASDERIKRMEFDANLNIAKVEANAGIIEKTFDAITATVDAVSGNISDLFGQIGDAKGLDKIKLERQIDRENNLREEAFDLERRLLEQQIEAQRIRNRRVAEGGGSIRVEMDGVYPELEVIMWELFKRVRLRLTETEGDFLLLGE